MKNKLFWRLCIIIAFGTVLLFWAIDWLTNRTETSMSFIAEEHQQQIIQYGQQAEKIMLQQGQDALSVWLQELQQKEQTWAAVATSDLKPIANSVLTDKFADGVWVGRSVEWMIHLYFDYNPVMDIPFSDQKTHFLIQLPTRMRPGSFLTYANLLLQIALPLLLLCVLSFVLYQHVMSPLRRLEKVTKEFSEGKLEVRTNASLRDRNDELTSVAATFDQMAERISTLIYNQRRLLADLSHELRTPLTRIDMAVDFVEQQINPKQALARLRYEASTMRSLVEDTLTLAWLNNESPTLNTDDFDLVELIQVICDDGRFEYPDRILTTLLPEQGLITQSSQLALGQAIENIIRNGLRYTPKNGEVEVSLRAVDQGFRLVIKDQGPGVPEEMLSDIFKPFFRVDKARSTQGTIEKETGSSGFGLGLALAHRQITAVGGSIKAANCHSVLGERLGLKIIIELTH
jgi:two-component system sensor histidine kinase PfeS